MANAAIHCFLGFPYKPRNPSLAIHSPSQLKLPFFKSLNSSCQPALELFSKGRLSMSTSGKQIRQSVVCMARRYGSNTRKRMIKSRRRGGDPEKKKKRKRKVGRMKKDKSGVTRLVSAAGTGYVYVKIKGKTRKMKEKLEIKKYDPTVKRHVLFKEEK